MLVVSLQSLGAETPFVILLFSAIVAGAYHCTFNALFGRL